MDGAAIRRYFKSRHDIDVGLYSYGCFDRWRMPGPLRVGRYCSIASTTRRVPGNHPTVSLTTYPALYERRFGIVDKDPEWPPLVIEDDVWIGHNTVILPRCTHIGRGAIIGAGSIVTANVEAYTVVAGNPARKLRDRFEPALARAIDASRWWELSLDDLRLLAAKRRDMVFHPDVAAIEAWNREAGR